MIKAVLQLIRFPNLLIIAVTQFLMRYCVIYPFLEVNGFSLQLSLFRFSLLVLSTLLITAAGYTINDYFDTRTDRLNKPERVVIDKVIPRGTAIKAHTLLSVLGVLIGSYVSFSIGVPGLSVIFILAAGLLWFYSTNYKRQFLLGNLIVSFLTGMVPILVILFELPLLNREYGIIMIKAGSSFNYIFYWVAGFAFFAFLTNFIREIIKDAEDFEGDSAYGMNTIPIMLGIRLTKIILVTLITLFNLILFYVIYRYILITGSGTDYLSGGYYIFTIGLPSIYVIFMVIKARNKLHYRRASIAMKFIMLFGILYSLLVYYSVLYRLNQA